MTAQALPNDAPNLAQMFQYLPAIASYQSGAQQGLADENNQRLQMAHDAEQGHLALERPLSLAELAARTDQHGANAGLARAQTAGIDLTNRYTGATQSGRIAATNAGYNADDSVAGLKKLEADGAMYGQLATQMEGMTPWERVNLVKTALGDRLPQHPALEAGLMKNADTLPQWMAKLSRHSYEQSAKAQLAADRQAMMENLQRLKNSGALDVAEENAAGRIAAKGAGGGKGGEKPLTMSQWEAQMRAAANAGDEAAAAALQRLEADRVTRNQAAGAPADGIKRDLLRLPQRAPVPGASVAPQGPPQASGPKALPAGLPQGTKDNGDGTFTLPDGQRVRPKAK
jgi:hypothetical protein